MSIAFLTKNRKNRFLYQKNRNVIAKIETMCYNNKCREVINLFGDRLRKARLNANITQQELATKIGAKANSVSNWEKGISRPDIEQVGQICTVLNVSANFLIDTSEISETITPTDKIMLNKYHCLDTYGKKLIDKALDIEYERCITQYSQTQIAIRAARSDTDKPIEVVELSEDKFANAPPQKY